MVLTLQRGFLVEQLPDVIYQLLLWYGVYNFAMFLVGLVLIPCSLVLFIKCSRGRLSEGHWAYAESPYDEMSFLGLCGFISSGVLFGIGMVNINVEWLQIWIAPKIWLLEYTAKLTGN